MEREKERENYIEKKDKKSKYIHVYVHRDRGRQTSKNIFNTQYDSIV